ncbi:hypothetical protein HY251_10130 [bacterium]|nr:hypothetical protein [bacterium]
MKLEALLDRARSRMALSVSLARAAWLALAGLLALEVGALAARGLGETARTAGAAVMGALLVSAVMAFFLGKKPTRAQAARQLDLALKRGALLETAAEALEGKHGPLGALVVLEAAREADGAEIARLAPVEAPRGFAAGAAFALLLLAVALGPAAAPARAEARAPFFFSDSTSPGASGKKDKGASSSEKPRDPDSVKVALRLGSGQASAAPGASSEPERLLSPEMEKLLSEKLRALARELASRATPSSGKPLAPSEERSLGDALEGAIGSGDARTALEALTKLEESGTKASQEALARAAQALERSRKRKASGPGSAAGSGSDPVSATPVALASSPRETGPIADPARDPGREARARVPYRVRLAEARYTAALEAPGGP